MPKINSLLQNTQSNKIVQLENLKLVYIKDIDMNVLPEIQNSDAVIIDYEATKAYRLISLIRSHHHPKVSLTPILINITSRNSPVLPKNVSEPVKVASDFIIDKDTELEELVQDIKDIIKENRKFYSKVLHKDLELSNILRFVLTRKQFDSQLTPIVNSKCLIGYEYPIAELQFKPEDYKAILSTLQKAVDYELLKPSFVDTLHLCPKCFTGFHNIKEVCPSCGSSNLDSETTIHHFVCANISPESEYVTSTGELLCPQCNRFLKNIGIDYDKPSFIYECNNCEYQFQDPEMKSFCFHCQTISEIENLIPIPISIYEITNKGILFAHTGQGLGDDGSEAIRDGYISRNTYVTMFKLEKRKAWQQGSELITGLLKIENPELLSEELFDDLCTELRSKSPDFVYIYENNRRFGLIFPHTFLFDDVKMLYKFTIKHLESFLKTKGVETTIRGKLSLFKNKSRETVTI